MSKQSVFLVGATGATGGAILDALLDEGSFDVTCLVRTASANKPSAQKLRDRGLKVVTGDLDGPQESLVALLKGIDTVISCIFFVDIPSQKPLIDAASLAGVKRFVPCSFGTPGARGTQVLRDLKEDVNDHIFRAKLGFTVIDVGYWHQISFPRVPSGKFDYAIIGGATGNEVYAGGEARNMLMHLRDVGRLTARIVKDERTLNKKVYGYGDVLTQKEIIEIVERKSGEKVETTSKSADEILAEDKAVGEAYRADPKNLMNNYAAAVNQYITSKYVREENTPENAEYLGYVSARELYPDFEFVSFEGFVDELLSGKAKKPFA